MRFPLTVAASVLLAGAAAAQPGEGDLVLADSQGNLRYVNWPEGPLQTLVAGLGATGMTPLPGNTAIACQLMNGAIVAVEADGTVTPIAQLPVSGGGSIVLDQDQSLLAAARTEGTVFRIEGPVVTPFYTRVFQLPILGLDRHGDTGDFVFIDDSTSLYALDRLTAQRSIFAPGVEFTPSGILYVKSNGWVWADYAFDDVTLLYDRDGNYLGNLSFGGYYLFNDEKRHRVFGAANPDGFHDDVIEMAPDGTILLSRVFPGTLFEGVTVWGARNVAFDTSGKLGTVANVEISFPESPKRPYCATLAGVRIPGHFPLPLREVFFLNACGGRPGATFFGGRTNADGLATISFTIPPTIHLPYSIYASAMVFDPALPGGVAVSNIEVAKLN